MGRIVSAVAVVLVCVTALAEGGHAVSRPRERSNGRAAAATSPRASVRPKVSPAGTKAPTAMRWQIESVTSLVEWRYDRPKITDLHLRHEITSGGRPALVVRDDASGKTLVITPDDRLFRYSALVQMWDGTQHLADIEVTPRAFAVAGKLSVDYVQRAYVKSQTQPREALYTLSLAAWPARWWWSPSEKSASVSLTMGTGKPDSYTVESRTGPWAYDGGVPPDQTCLDADARPALQVWDYAKGGRLIRFTDGDTSYIAAVRRVNGETAEAWVEVERKMSGKDVSTTQYIETVFECTTDPTTKVRSRGRKLAPVLLAGTQVRWVWPNEGEAPVEGVADDGRAWRQTVPNWNGQDEFPTEPPTVDAQGRPALLREDWRTHQTFLMTADSPPRDYLTFARDTKGQRVLCFVELGKYSDKATKGQVYPHRFYAADWDAGKGEWVRGRVLNVSGLCVWRDW